MAVTSCGAERERPDGDGSQLGAGAAGENGSGAAGGGGTTSGGEGSGASDWGGSRNGCESACEVGGAAGTSGGTSGGGGTDSGGGAGSADGADAGSGEASRVFYLTTTSSYEDASQYTLGPMTVGDAAPDRSLFVVVQSASNGATSAEIVRVNGVEATKLVAVGEDAQPSAPSALFLIPFPTDYQATVELQMSSPVVRCAVSLFVAYGLHNPAGVDDSETLVVKTSGSITVDVAAGGTVITALAMATNSSDPTAELTGIQGTGYGELLSEGTPTLLRVLASDSRSAGPATVSFVASDPTFSFRAFAAAVH